MWGNARGVTSNKQSTCNKLLQTQVQHLDSLHVTRPKQNPTLSNRILYYFFSNKLKFHSTQWIIIIVNSTPFFLLCTATHKWPPTPTPTLWRLYFYRLCIHRAKNLSKTPPSMTFLPVIPVLYPFYALFMTQLFMSLAVWWPSLSLLWKPKIVFISPGIKVLSRCYAARVVAIGYQVACRLGLSAGRPPFSIDENEAELDSEMSCERGNHGNRMY
jgi:uncharacterized protein (DUF486 family)